MHNTGKADRAPRKCLKCKVVFDPTELKVSQCDKSFCGSCWRYVR